MNKLETARQLAKQTAGQQQYTGTEHQQVNESEDIASQAEVINFLQAVQEILKLAQENGAMIRKLQQQVTRVEKDHWTQVRMLIFLILLPLIMSITAMIILISRK